MLEIYSGDENNNKNSKEYEELMEKLKEHGKDNTYEIFMEYYKKHYGLDFQEQVSKDLPVIQDEGDFEGLNKNIELKKQEKENKINEKDISDEKKFKQTLREKVYTNYYEHVFKQYAALLDRALREQSEREDFSISDKQGTELVLYEKYLQDLDIICKNNNINLNENDSIKSAKKQLKADVDKRKKTIEHKNNTDIEQIDKINQRRNQIAKRLDDISFSMNGGSSKDYEYEIKQLRKEYIDLTYRLRTQEPTLEQIELQATRKEKNQEYAVRTYGSNNELANEYSIGVNVEDSRKDFSGSSKDTTNKAMEYKVNQTQNTTIQAEEMLESAEEAIKDGNFDDADKYINISDMYSSSEQVSQEQVKENKETTTKKDLDKQLQSKEDKNKGEQETSKTIRGIEEDNKDNSIYDECRNNVANEEEQKKLYYLEQIEKRRNQIRGIEKENKESADKTDIDYVRVINKRMN